MQGVRREGVRKLSNPVTSLSTTLCSLAVIGVYRTAGQCLSLTEGVVGLT